MSPLLEIRDLHTYFATREGVVKAVNGVSLTLEADSVLGVMGESGSGKTMTALSVMRLVPFPGKIVGGEILYDGRDLLSMNDNEMRRIRGQEISLVFQDASSALNPVITVGKQVEELMLEHTGMSKRQARGLAVELLSQFGNTGRQGYAEQVSVPVERRNGAAGDDSDWGRSEAEDSYSGRADV